MNRLAHNHPKGISSLTTLSFDVRQSKTMVIFGEYIARTWLLYPFKHHKNAKSQHISLKLFHYFQLDLMKNWTGSGNMSKFSTPKKLYNTQGSFLDLLLRCILFVLDVPQLTKLSCFSTLIL